MKKRFLSIFLAAVMLVSLVPATAAANESPNHGFTVTKANGEPATGKEKTQWEPAPENVDYYWEDGSLFLVKDNLVVSGKGKTDEMLYVGQGENKVSTVTFQNLSTNNLIYLSGPDSGLTLTLMGENQIGCAVEKPDEGIKLGSNVVVTGNGNLTIFDKYDGILLQDNFDGHNLEFDENFTGTLTIWDAGDDRPEQEPEPPCAISIGNGTLTVNGGTLNLHSEEKSAITAGVVIVGDELVVYAGGAAGGIAKQENYTTSVDDRIVYIAKPHIETVNGNKQEFAPWFGNTSLPTTAGNWYLTDDVTLTNTWSPKAGSEENPAITNLCLNGHVITMNGTICSVIKVDTNATLNLYDCGTTKHYFAVGDNGLWTLTNTETENYVIGGVITGGKLYPTGGGVYVAPGGTFNMNSGNIVGNTASALGSGGDGGGVNVASTGTFKMTGGTITGNTATASGGGVSVADGGTFTMNGGSITGNKASTSGGGVYVGNGSFVMRGGSITGNEASTNGGGVVLANEGSSVGIIGTAKIASNTAVTGGGVCVMKGDFTMGGGTIEKNTAAGNGGGIFNGTYGTVTVGLYATSTISDNNATDSGGGIYSSGALTLYTATIDGNTASNKGGGIYAANYVDFRSTTTVTDCEAQNGGGVYVANNGWVEDVGGKITDNTASENGGGVYVENGGTATFGNSASVTDNEAANGGGIYSKGAVGLGTSTISDNTATGNGGGIYLAGGETQANGGSIFLGEDAKVKNNTGGNLYLCDNILLAKFGVAEDQDVPAPTSSMEVYVTTQTPPRADNPVVTIITSAQKAYEGYIKSDNNDYVVAFVSNHLELQVKPTPPSGGGSSTPTVNVPVSGDKDSVKVTATVSGGNATVKNVTAEQLETVGTGENVTIDLSSLSKSVSGVTIPKTTLENVAASDADGLEVKLPNGTTAVFDRTTVAAVAEQAAGSNIQLVVDKENKAEQALTAAQKETVKELNDALVLDAYFVSNGKRISDFKGGEAELTVSYPTTKPVRVWYVAEDGTKELVPSTFDGKAAKFVVTHFSHYAIEILDGSSYAACPQDNTCVYAKFTDANTAAWYHDGVHYCVENGYMQGVSDTKFAPSGTLSRAMIVTMLWRLEGEPVVNYAMSFKDVKADQWYTEAIRWAAAEKIVSGYDAEHFGPNDPVTREQLAAILYRYAVLKGVDTEKFTENTNTLSHTDVFTISEWANAGMHFCIAAGVVNGDDNGNLNPRSTATRAEAAAMFQRFCENIMSK